MKKMNKSFSLLIVGGGVILAILLFIMLLNKREGFQTKSTCYISGRPPEGGKCCIRNPPDCRGVCGGRYKGSGLKSGCVVGKPTKGGIDTSSTLTRCTRELLDKGIKCWANV